jgi:hypothetical protein
MKTWRVEIEYIKVEPYYVEAEDYNDAVDKALELAGIEGVTSASFELDRAVRTVELQ